MLKYQKEIKRMIHLIGCFAGWRKAAVCSGRLRGRGIHDERAVWNHPAAVEGWRGAGLFQSLQRVPAEWLCLIVSLSLSFLAYFLPCTARFPHNDLCAPHIMLLRFHCGRWPRHWLVYCVRTFLTWSRVIIDIIPSIMAHDSNMLYANFSKMQICPVFSKHAVNPYLLHTTQTNNSMA